MQVIPNIVPEQVPSLFSASSSKELQGGAEVAASGGAAAAPASYLTTSHNRPQANWDSPLHWTERSYLDGVIAQEKAKHARCDDMIRHAKEYERRISQSPPIEYYTGGNLIKLPCTGPYRKMGGGQRQECKGFSWQSRSRLMRTLGTFNRDVCGLPLFVTLTYPGEFAMNDRIWKRDLAALGKRLRRQFPDAFFVWKLEPQQRGAPHYHILLWGVSEAFSSWLRRAWYEVVGSGNVWHLRMGANIQQVHSWHGVASYAAKYLGKEVERLPKGWKKVGRWWGIHNRKALPIQKVTVRVEQPVCNSIRRVIRKFMEKTNGKRCKWLRPYRTWKCLLADRGDVLMGRLVEWAKRLVDPYPDEPDWIHEQIGSHEF